MSRTSREAIQADFDRIARLVADEPDRPDRYESFLLTQLPNPCRKVLEIGCGAGRLARAIADRGATVTGIDASPEMIRLACQRSSDDPRIEFVCRDFAVHSAESEVYDCVVSVATLHHLPAAATLARMKSMVRPGGLLLIHDVRSLAGIGDGVLSGLAAAFNGDAVWWVRHRLRQNQALRDAWRDHGQGERYLTMGEVRVLCKTMLPGATSYRHPLWRYTIVWTKREAGAP
jgi:2-polyprenyl-3-methyl-5-hydroxy-6-metoxy-1,4-benzoquinol methylase